MENEKIDVLKVVGQNIKQARLLRGLTQEVLSEKINKSTNFVSLVERGASGISLSTIVDICNVLEISTDTIFNGLIISNKSTGIEPLVKSLSLLKDNDIAIVSNLIEYIINSK